MKTFYIDDEKFVKRINKFRKHRLNKRVLESHWAVVEKITIKTKTIGKIPYSEKKSKKNNSKRGEDVKDVAAEKTKDGGIMGGEFGVCFLDFNDLTRDDIKEICSILEIQESFDADTKQDRDEEGDGDEIGDVTVPEVDLESEEPVEAAGKEIDCSILKEADANPIVSELARDDIKVVNDVSDNIEIKIDSDDETRAETDDKALTEEPIETGKEVDCSILKADADPTIVEGSIIDQGGGIYIVYFSW